MSRNPYQNASSGPIEAPTSSNNTSPNKIVDATELLGGILEAPLAQAKKVPLGINWYCASLDEAQSRMGELVDFAHWLARVNRLFDQALPHCWIHHPWLVMIVDSLLVSYQEAYLSAEKLSRHQYVLSVVPDAMSAIQTYAANFALYEHDHAVKCPSQDDEDDVRDSFTQYYPRHEYTPSWPWDTCSAQQAIYNN